MKRPARVASDLPESLHKRLNAYALAASAAGVGVLILAKPAEAKIVYSPAHVVIGSSHGLQHYSLDLNHDEVADFSFVANSISFSSGAYAYLDCAGSAPGNVWGRSEFDSALRQGIRIGPCGRFNAPDQLMAAVGIYREQSSFIGPWANGGRGVKNRYLGLRFVINGETHFGWARLNVNVQPNNVNATLTGYAYETIPNKPIIAGKRHGKDDMSVQPASLEALAAGSSAFPLGANQEPTNETPDNSTGRIIPAKTECLCAGSKRGRSGGAGGGAACHGEGASRSDRFCSVRQ
jgi:hypothetical protein